MKMIQTEFESSCSYVMPRIKMGLQEVKKKGVKGADFLHKTHQTTKTLEVVHKTSHRQFLRCFFHTVNFKLRRNTHDIKGIILK